MNKQIWKFPFDITDNQTILLPKYAEILCVQNQNENPCIWALVNPEEEKEIIHLELFGTGHNVPCGMGVERNYIGTFQMEGGSLVFHLFERI